MVLLTIGVFPILIFDEVTYYTGSSIKGLQCKCLGSNKRDSGGRSQVVTDQEYKELAKINF